MMKDLGRRISATHCNGLGMLPFSVTLRPKGARGGAAEAIGEFVNLQSTQFQVSLSRRIAVTLDEERSLSALSTAPDLSTMFAGGLIGPVRSAQKWKWTGADFQSEAKH